MHMYSVNGEHMYISVVSQKLVPICGYPLQDDEGSSSGQVNFDWNPYADCKEFSFYDQGFLDKIKDGHTVSCLH